MPVDFWLIYKQAEYMTSYEHHSGYPRYDGGHTEPETTCQQVNCKGVREFKEWLDTAKDSVGAHIAS